MDGSITPAVTVVLPAYNAEAYLRDAIESVLAQTYTHFELLVIDDGSTDTTSTILETFSDCRIRRIVHKQNQGLIATLNEGLREAQGTFIARIDADDVWHATNKLKKQIDFLQKHPEYALVGTNAITIDETGKILGKIKVPSSDSAIRRQILIKNPFIHPSVVFTKQAALAVGGFARADTHAEDYGLWLRMATTNKVANIPEMLMSYRITQTGITRTKQQLQIKASFELARQFKQFYPHFALAWVKWTIKLFLNTVFSHTK